MTEKKLSFNVNDCFICPHCKELSSMSFANSWGKSVTFPNGDFSMISTACPRCKKPLSIPNDKLLKRGIKSTDESDILKKENADLLSENERLSSENEELKKKLYTTEGRLHEYRRMYGTNDSFVSDVTNE